MHLNKLLEPDSSLIQPREDPPIHDRVPEAIAVGTSQWLRDDLIELIGEEQVLSRAIGLVRFASNASPFRMFPKVVVAARSNLQIRERSRERT